jgi:3-hydroxyacyl-[acyl-carrier-protein] dehydratase
MKRASDLYTIRITGITGTRISALVLLDPEHAIYDGHFPGFPLTPGVCQVAMIRDILRKGLDRSFRLTGAKFVKFTAMHQPGNSRELTAELSYREEREVVAVDAKLSHMEGTVLKMKGTYIEQRG